MSTPSLPPSSGEAAAPALVVHAPAKINLTLDVLGKRPDGYHELRSVMQTLQLHDTLELWPASLLTLECEVSALAGPQNLVWRAACLLRDHTGYAGGARLVLHKKIPIDAGLGGGSSNAAATLLGLNHLWNLGLPRETLAALGANLGSDVPFFFYGPTALISGRGEFVERLAPAPLAHVVLHKPASGVSTAQVFGRLSPAHYSQGEGTEALLAAWRAGLSVAEWPLSNGLQEAVSALYGDVEAALDRLREAGASQAVMTGSGSTVYALFADEDSARHTYEQFIADGLIVYRTTFAT